MTSTVPVKPGRLETMLFYFYMESTVQITTLCLLLGTAVL